MPRILGIEKSMRAPMARGAVAGLLVTKQDVGSKSQGQGTRALSVASKARLELQHTSLSADLPVVGRTQQTLRSKPQRTMCITKPMSPSATSRGLLNGVDRPAIQIRWPMVTHRHSKVAAVRHVHVAASKVEASPAPVDRILANSQIKHSRAGFNADLVTSHTEQPTLFSPDAEFVQLGTTHRMGSRPFRASHVVAAASISPALPSTTMDVPPLKSLSKHPALPLLSLPTDAFIQVMHKVAAQQHALWQQVSVVAAEATKLTTIPDLAAALLRSSAAVTKSVQDQFHEDAARLQQAWVALQSRRGTLMELQAKVASLEAERESLQGQLDEARHRAQFAESSSAGLSVQLEEKKALSTLDDAAQVFRRHVCGVPLDLTPSQFHEHPDNVIGKGGCATVFKWRVGQTDWAVKSDPISYRHVMHEFDPQRCGDLLPAFLPPHPNIMAPKAWWVRSLALAQAQAISATPPAATTKTSSKPVTGFKLYTLYEKYTCSLWDFMQSMHTDQQKTNSTTPKAAANCPTAFNGGAFAAVAASEPLLLDLSSLLVVVRDVAAALEHLAVHRVVHGDVKAENVLLVLQPAPAGAEHTPQKVARAVLIDFGLCCMLPQGVDKMTARGGTWMYKAPEQMTGPPGIELGGQAMSAEPHVELQTDVWSLGLLICMLCNNGALPSKSGLPFGVPPEQLLKWGDRPKGVSHEPFWMSWDDVLPKMPGTPGAHQARLDNWDGCVEGCLPRGEGLERQHAHVMALLRRLAQGCLQKDPSQRPTAAQVRVAVAEALAGLSC